MPLHLTSIPLRHCTQYASLYSLGVNLGERPCLSPYNLHPFNVRLILPYLPYALLSLPLLLPFPYLGCKIPQRGLGLIPNRNRIWCTWNVIQIWGYFSHSVKLHPAQCVRLPVNANSYNSRYTCFPNSPWRRKIVNIRQPTDRLSISRTLINEQ